MNKTGTVVASLLASVACALAQAPDPHSPSEITPKQISPPAAGKAQPLELKSPRSPAGDKPINPDKPDLSINGIIIVTNKSEIQEAGVPAMAGLVVKDHFLDRPDFKAMVTNQFLGKRLTENLIRDLEDAIILYCRDRGRILVDVILPEQSIENGVMQLWLLEGKVGHINVANEGTRWFKDKFILDNVRLRTGDPLDSRELNKDLNWLNNNPFRQVDVTFKPGDKLGVTDLQLHVDDRLPLRPYIGYEDSGTRFTGPDRLLAGLNWGNAFGLDHQFNYQYATDTDFEFVRAHSASYIAPLPWRHTLMVYGSYVDAKADLGLGTSSEGHSWQTSFRYSVPMPQFGRLRNQVSAGFDFKRSNNNLLAGGTPISGASDTDIDQFVLEYTALLPDRWGRTSIGLEGYYSPGELTEHNNSEDFDTLRRRASAHYFYGRLNAERITRLPRDFSWVLRGWAQYSPNERLLPSEELAIGGYSTVRGYDERILLGDSGWVIDNELRTPPFHLINYFHLPVPSDSLQFLGFFDYGAIRIRNAGPDDGNDPDKDLYSVGAGLRYAVGPNFALRFDYGFPLTHKELNEHPNGRVHLGALLSF